MNQIFWHIVIYEETKSEDGSLQLENLADEIHCNYESLVKEIKVLINKGYRFEVTAMERNEVIVPEDMRSEVIEYVMERYRWERAYVEINGDIYTPNDLFDILSAINRSLPINDLYYSDVVIDHFNLK